MMNWLKLISDIGKFIVLGGVTVIVMLCAATAFGSKRSNLNVSRDAIDRIQKREGNNGEKNRY